MKKFLKGLRFFLCYVAITFATATGVVVYAQTTASQISNSNNPNNWVEQEENSLMDVISNLMNMSTTGINADVTLNDKDNNETKITLDLQLNISSGFSKVEADGKVGIKNDTLDTSILLTYLDSTAYIKAVDSGLDLYSNLSFSANSLKSAITSVLDLAGVSIGGDSFDVTSLLGYMGDYKETKTETGLDISLDFMGYHINMACDKDLNLTGVKVSDVKVKDYTLNLDLSLTPQEQEYNIAKPQDTFVNIDSAMKVVTYLDEIKNNGHFGANIKGSYNGEYINANLSADLDNSLAMLSTRAFGGISVVYDNSDIYTALSNIKLKTTKTDIDTLTNFIKQDVKDTINNVYPELLSKLKDSYDKLMSSVENAKNNLTISDILSHLNAIKVTDDYIMYSKDGITFTINLDSDKISSINASAKGFDIVIDSIDMEKQTIAINKNEYIAFEEVYPTLKALVNTINTKAIAGNITSNIASIKNAKFALSYKDGLTLQLAANVFSQDIGLSLKDSNAYIAIKDIKAKVALSDLPDIIAYIGEAFGLNISLDNMASSIQTDFDLSIITSFSAVTKMINGHSLNGVEINVNGTYITVLNQQDHISHILVDSKDASFVIKITGYGDIAFENIDYSEYSSDFNYKQYIDGVSKLLNAFGDETTDQFVLGGNAKLYKVDENGNTVIVNENEDAISLDFSDMRFDATSEKPLFFGTLIATGNGSLYDSILKGYDHTFNAQFDGNYIYFNYNGLRVKFSRQSNKEFVTSLQDIVSNYLGDSELGKQLVKVLGLVEFDDDGNMLLTKIDTSEMMDKLEDFLPLIKTLKANDDGSLSLGVDLSSLVPTFTDEVVINLSIDNGKLTLSVSKLKLSADMMLDFSIYIDTADMFTVNPQESYMDMTSIGSLLSAIDNTVQKTTTDNKVFNVNLSGSAHIKAKVSFINIDRDIPFDAQLTIDTTKNEGLPFEAKIYLDIPKISLLNGTTKIYTTLYITDTLEGEPILYINRTGKPLKSKYKLSEFSANISKIISDITNISEDTLALMLSSDIKYIDGPSKAENILKDYSYVNQTYNIGLDLRQLTLMDMMLGYSDSNKTSLSLESQNKAISAINISNVTLEAISNVFIYASANINLSNIGEKFDIKSEINSIDTTEYGRWDDGSLVITFEENGGSDVANKMVITGRTITLPESTKEVENGNTLEVYTLLGWCRNSDLSDEPMTGDYLMTETTDITLYAKWQLKKVYTKYTINFIDNVIGETISHSVYGDYSLDGLVPEKAQEIEIHDEVNGVTTTYEWAGWYFGEVVDGELVYGEKFVGNVMPNSDINVYAKWNVLSTVSQRKLSVIDINPITGEQVEVYGAYFVDNSEIDIATLVTHKDTTKWYAGYENGAYINEYTSVNYLPSNMPNSDLYIYIANVYTVTLSSKHGDTETKVVSGYQGQTFELPHQQSYEVDVYSGGVPSYLNSYNFLGYEVESGTDINGIVPNYNITLNAKWDILQTSYNKIEFNVEWVKPSAWVGSNHYKSTTNNLPTEMYVLSGSTMHGTTLTIKKSALGLEDDEVYETSDKVKLEAKYLINYTFIPANWNADSSIGCTNHNTGKYNKTTTIITKNTVFNLELKDKNSGY